MSEIPPSRNAIATCSRCGDGLVPDDRFCGGCGARVNNCRSCGTPLVAGNRSCPQCGIAVDQSKLTAMLSKPGLAPVATTEWTEILAKVQAATIGELHFMTQLGRGGMAAVYLAEDIRLRRKVAVKLILPELMSDERMVQRFQEEASTVASLRHANIVRVFAVREAAGIHFFTMDYIEGRSLESILETAGALPIPVVRSVLAQVASALGQAHKQGVFHRDVKPANILVDTDGNAYITDFGIAKVSNEVTKRQSLTQVGAVVGTPAYISPEQCLARPVTGASDQYSLGVVAYEMVAGHQPFEEQNSFALMRCHTDEPVPPLRARCSACPEDLEAAILRMLSKKPEDRFRTMAEAVAALGARVLPDDDADRLAFAELAVPAPLPPSAIINTPPIAHDANVTIPAASPAVSIRMTPPPVVAVSVAGLPQSLDVGKHAQATVTITDAKGHHVDRAVVWTSTAPDVATVAPDGSVTGIGVGRTQIVAAIDGVEGSADLGVAARRIVVTPRPLGAAGPAAAKATSPLPGRPAETTAKKNPSATFLDLPSVEQTPQATQPGRELAGASAIPAASIAQPVKPVDVASTPPVPPPREETPRAAGKPRAALPISAIAAGVGVVVVLAGVGYFATRGGSRPADPSTAIAAAPTVAPPVVAGAGTESAAGNAAVPPAAVAVPPGGNHPPPAPVVAPPARSSGAVTPTPPAAKLEQPSRTVAAPVARVAPPVVAPPTPAPAPVVRAETPAPAPVVVAESKSTTIPGGTQISVTTQDEVTSKTAAVGDPLTFRVMKPVIVKGTVVIAEGAVVKATVSEANAAGRMGRGGLLSVNVETARTVDGQRVKLRASATKEEGASNMKSTVALTVLFGGVGLFKKGEDVVMKPGTEIKVFTDQDLKIAVP